MSLCHAPRPKEAAHDEYMLISYVSQIVTGLELERTPRADGLSSPVPASGSTTFPAAPSPIHALLLLLTSLVRRRCTMSAADRRRISAAADPNRGGGHDAPPMVPLPMSGTRGCGHGQAVHG